MAGHDGRDLMEDELEALRERERLHKPPAVSATYIYADASLELVLEPGKGGAQAVLMGCKARCRRAPRRARTPRPPRSLVAHPPPRLSFPSLSLHQHLPPLSLPFS